jgi:carboxylate-amine ligase
MRELLAVVAFTHCAAVWLAREYEEGRLKPLDRHWVTSENKWRAARWGLDAQMILDDHGTQMRNDKRITEMLAKLRPLGEELNCAAELANVEEILELGPSYLRQRKIFEQTGRLESVVDALVEEWRTNERVTSA